MYFQPVDGDLEAIGILAPFTKQLVSCLIHTFRQGVYLADDQSRAPIDTKSSSGTVCQKYVTSALKSDVAADKLFSLRRTGPSVKLMVQLLPFTSKLTSKTVFQLCIWRTFAFGHREHMKESTLSLDSKPLNLDTLAETIKTWGGPVQILVQAYGNFQVKKSRATEMLEKLWECSVAVKEKKGNPTFAEVYNFICEHDIPSVRQGGIVVWLLSCDLSEYGLCLPPTATDLAKHMLEGKSKPAGPAKGLEVAGKIAGEAVPLGSVETLAAVFEEVIGVFGNPNQKSQVVIDMVNDCEKLQGRKFTVADLEHGLCKIAREESLSGRGKKTKAK